MKHPLSIRTYLAISQVLIIAVALAIMSFTFSTQLQTQITAEIGAQMRDRVQRLAAYLEKDSTYQADDQMVTMAIPGTALEIDLTAVFIDEQQEVRNLAASEVTEAIQSSINDIKFERFPDDPGAAEVIRRPGGSEQMYVLANVNEDSPGRSGKVCLFLALNPINRYIARQRLILGGFTIGLGLLGIAATVLLTRPFILRANDVRELASAAVRPGRRLHVPETGPRETREISRYLNEMVDKLDEQEELRRTILANVTHELGRPLAGLRLGIESLQKGAIERPELAEDLLNNMAQAAQQMELLLDDISLTISPVPEALRLQPGSISVQPFLQGIASRFWTMAETRGVKLKVHAPPGLAPIHADERRLTQIMGNLVHNAIKFSARRGTIQLSAEAGEHNTVRLIVQDRGKGISPEDLAHVFDAFYQGQHGLQIKQGMGLGLSIALQLARLHGGDLELRANPAGGTIAVLIMPADTA